MVHSSTERRDVMRCHQCGRIIEDDICSCGWDNRLGIDYSGLNRKPKVRYTIEYSVISEPKTRPSIPPINCIPPEGIH